MCPTCAFRRASTSACSTRTNSPVAEQGQAGYLTAIAALEERGRFGVRLGLARTRALLRALGGPERELRGALIGGTNGKGSVQAIVASILGLAGLRVGQAPKPHLVSYRERMVVDGRPIPVPEFSALVGDVLEVAERLPRRLGPATEFELLTAAAFTWFARRNVQLAVVEVGLGGRLDATNAWDGGVAAITNVALDHTERLGPTVEAIAREKAAIIKRGDRAVTGASRPALAILARRARRLGVPLEVVRPLEVVGMTRGGLSLRDQQLGELRLGLLGRHQATNAAVGLGVIRALEAAGLVRVSESALRAGLERVIWPGRLELLCLARDGAAAAPASIVAAERGRPDVLLDGAHNEAGMAALVAALDELRPLLSAGRPTLLLALMREKRVAAMCAQLARSAALRGARIIATSMDTERSLAAGELAHRLRQALGEAAEVEHVAPADEAIGRALEVARREDGALVVAGSLYLVGAVRGRLIDEPDLRDPVPSAA